MFLCVYTAGLTGYDSGNQADCVQHSWQTENPDADLVGEEDQSGLYRYVSLVLQAEVTVTHTRTMPSFFPP